MIDNRYGNVSEGLEGIVRKNGGDRRPFMIIRDKHGILYLLMPRIMSCT